MSREMRVFISYSHKDAYWMQSLLPLLRFPRVRVKSWNDKEIKPGLRWDDEINRELDEMNVFIALVSVHFVVSPYIQAVECRKAKERQRKEGIEVVPVLIDHTSDEECEWLMKFQRLPPGEKSWVEVLRDFKEYDMALSPIRDGIKTVIERARMRTLGA